jgi:hypothetical protein
MLRALSFVSVLLIAGFALGCDNPEPADEKAETKTVEQPSEEAAGDGPAVKAESKTPVAAVEPEPPPPVDGQEPEVEPAPKVLAPVDPQAPVPSSQRDASEGKPCTSNAECPGGACIGDGLEGCGGAPGRCGPDRCTRDRRAYCGCDGVTFHASGKCPGAEYAYRGECKSAQADGAACLSGSDCKSGICEGQGCGNAAAGKCMSRKRQCTLDAVEYCACDGTVFRGSGTCANRRYRKRGACGS